MTAVTAGNGLRELHNEELNNSHSSSDTTSKAK
jgi:hypothetical protein